ncbi:MAG: 4Fe-4S dicluster domain-containing protein [Lachnospiraceae bacterium]|nr:4Fe-4S dicluster domain-containing protein [Lachnospiraceae bacterium]MDD3797408.1 4Fe-4S dicluster domain-containing protein [Lachnospiraceae bacterium]
MKRIMIDETKCDGCRNCELACMQAHRSTPGSIYDLDLTSRENESRNHIVSLQDGSYRPIFCRHCDQPECVMSCMSGALKKDPDTGLVLYDGEKCGSCFMCVMNCPYGVLRPDRTRTRVLKCDFCTSAGTEPSCVGACPRQAIYLEEVIG